MARLHGRLLETGIGLDWAAGLMQSLMEDQT